MRYRIGTSGYSYADWNGVFYPAGLPAAERLPFYAQHFDCVELNATYYRIPGAKSFAGMAEKTPDQFRFIIKTHQDATHRREDPRPSMQQLLAALQPLRECGKLHGLLAQFPYAFKNTYENRRYLLTLKELCADQPLFVEFRNWTWQRDELYPFLKLNDIGYVNVDQPRLKGLLSPQAEVTAEGAYVRFHGRNNGNWWKGTNATRYDYQYSREELGAWLERLLYLVKNASTAYIFFNNHPNGQAVSNARLLGEMMQREIDSKQLEL